MRHTPRTWLVPVLVAVAACAPAAGSPSARTATPAATRARIVFAADAAVAGSDPRRAIFSVEPDGSRLVRLAHDPMHDLFAPAWSPDHRRIAYVRDRAIYVMDANGSGARRIATSAPDEGPAIDPAWSPDGKRIAYVTSCFLGRNWPSPGVVDTIRPGGRGRAVLARPAGPAPTNGDLAHLAQWSGHGAAELAWSPDGRRLVVALGASSTAYGSRFRLGLVTVSGGALVPLLPAIESPSFLGPDW